MPIQIYEDGSYQCLPGAALIAKVLAGRCQMHYTRAAVGQGTIPEGTSPKSLAEPPGYVMDAKIAAITNPIDGECQVTVQIYSADVMTGFYATGIMLYAEDPDLGEVPYTYLKLEEGLEWIRPASSAIGKLATFDLIVAVGAVDAVSANIAPDAVATYEAVKRIMEEHDTSDRAHSGLILRMKAMELAVNGSNTIIGDGDPTSETVGRKGQHYINADTGQEFVCLGIGEDGYIWEPVAAGQSIREQLEATMANETTIDDVNTRLTLLELMYRTQVSGNPFTVSFSDMSGLLVTGVWNDTLKRVEF